jgi:hypothetical protein
VGIDPRTKSDTVVAVDQASGQVLGRLAVAAGDRGHARPVRWAEGTSPREARRCIKRHLVNAVFRAMRADAPSTSTGEQPLVAAAVT